jgi:hypothetical protein
VIGVGQAAPEQQDLRLLLCHRPQSAERARQGRVATVARAEHTKFSEYSKADLYSEHTSESGRLLA